MILYVIHALYYRKFIGISADQWIMNHVCLIQIFGSVFLFMGALNVSKIYKQFGGIIDKSFLFTGQQVVLFGLVD